MPSFINQRLALLVWRSLLISTRAGSAVHPLADDAAAIPISQELPPASEVTQNFLGYGGFPAISTLISLQMFIHAPNPKFTPLGPSMNS